MIEGVSKTNWNSKEFLDELANSGVKYNADDLVAVTKTPDGKLVWLENGNSQAGLNHVMNHADDFAKKGIAKDEITDLVMTALNKGKLLVTKERELEDQYIRSHLMVKHRALRLL
ncbi:hypothetical protein [Clostridium septicum]|uniref:hypothetical protein n=1 Tax=Clostridium septicum TaxID=1504 RepID=UPI00196A8EF9|nr:hypothetical protein [Clostridium septicum]